MKLAGMATVLEKTITEATQDAWSYSEFIDVLLQAEWDHRERKKSERRIKASKLRIRPSFEDFDFTANRSITKTQIKEIYSLKWVE